MGRYGNPKVGLLKIIPEVIYEHGQNDIYDTDWITDRVKKIGYWEGRKKVDLPERTINSYFAQNPDVFTWVRKNRYRLTLKFLRPLPTPSPIDHSDTEPPVKILTQVYRTLRDTELVRKLKLIHDNRCQICDTVLEIGPMRYSEGHHIEPLGRRGPDIKGNILILCRNHHVLCDYGAIRLELADLRIDPRHKVMKNYIDWHNKHVFSKS